MTEKWQTLNARCKIRGDWKVTKYVLDKVPAYKLWRGDEAHGIFATAQQAMDYADGRPPRGEFDGFGIAP